MTPQQRATQIVVKWWQRFEIGGNVSRRAYEQLEEAIASALSEAQLQRATEQRAALRDELIAAEARISTLEADLAALRAQQEETKYGEWHTDDAGVDALNRIPGSRIVGIDADGSMELEDETGRFCAWWKGSRLGDREGTPKP